MIDGVKVKILFATRILLVFLFFCTSTEVSTQFFVKEYEEEISEANHNMRINEFDSAGIAFDKALKFVDGNYPFAIYYYEAAKCWSIAGDREKAFYYLENFRDKGWLPLEKIVSDTLLLSLHNDRRWKSFVQSIKVKQDEFGALRQQLEEIGHKDQVLRRIKNCVAIDSMDLDYYYEIRERQDIDNLAKVDSIVKLHGWLGMNKIGDRANDILWRVVHHATPEVRRKYLPVIRASVEKGETKPNKLALLEDRILISLGLPQKYGSQFVTIRETGENKVVTVSNPEHINERRRAIGLSKIEEYLSLCGIKEVTIETLSDPSTLKYMNRNKD